MQARFDFAPMDTVVEELVNSLKLTPARSTPVQVLLNESQVYDGTPDGTEEIIEGDDQEDELFLGDEGGNEYEVEPANEFDWSNFGNVGDVRRIHHGGEGNVIFFDLQRTEKGCF